MVTEWCQVFWRVYYLALLHFVHGFIHLFFEWIGLGCKRLSVSSWDYRLGCLQPPEETSQRPITQIQWNTKLWHTRSCCLLYVSNDDLLHSVLWHVLLLRLNGTAGRFLPFPWLSRNILLQWSADFSASTTSASMSYNTFIACKCFWCLQRFWCFLNAE